MEEEKRARALEAQMKADAKKTKEEFEKFQAKTMADWKTDRETWHEEQRLKRQQEGSSRRYSEQRSKHRAGRWTARIVAGTLGATATVLTGGLAAPFAAVLYAGTESVCQAQNEEDEQ